MAGQQEVDITVVIFGTLGMLILAFALLAFVVFYQKKRISQQIEMAKRESMYQQELLNTMLDAREKEQKRIAAELHDEVGSTLTFLKLKLTNPKFSITELSEVNRNLQDAINQVRQISHELFPPVLNELGLNGAIQNLCKKINGNHNITADFITNGIEGEMTKDEELNVYRIVQEILNNIIKHSGCTEILVSLKKYAVNQYELIIEDNGKGFIPPAELDFKNTSLGLKNLAARSQQLKAKLKYELRPQGGTKVILSK